MLDAFSEFLVDGAGQPLTITVPVPLRPANQRLMDTLGVRVTVTRTGPTEARRALAARAQQLYAEGKLQREIADILGISRSYAAALTSEDPLGEKARARKDRYRGVCEDCGAPTDGSSGPNSTPSFCSPCSHARQKADKVWTREAVIDAIQRFHTAHGRPPTATDWIRSNPANGYPPRSAVYVASKNSRAPFLKWADAIEAAGFPRPPVGHYKRPPKAAYRKTRDKGRTVSMRDFVVLEQQEDGSWIAHPAVNAYSEPLAVEAFVEASGSANGRSSHRFVAVPAHRWIVRELQPVTTLKAVVVEAVKA